MTGWSGWCGERRGDVAALHRRRERLRGIAAYRRRPADLSEAQAVVEAFREGRDEGERAVWWMVKERPALQKPPGGRGVAWIRRPTILGGPSYDV